MTTLNNLWVFDRFFSTQDSGKQRFAKNPCNRKKVKTQQQMFVTRAEPSCVMSRIICKFYKTRGWKSCINCVKLQWIKSTKQLFIIWMFQKWQPNNWRTRQTYTSLSSQTQQPSHPVFEHYKLMLKKLTKFLEKCSQS